VTLHCGDVPVLQEATARFYADTVSISAAGTTTSLTVPFAGNFTAVALLDSGAKLGTYELAVQPSAAHAPASELSRKDAVPGSLPVGSTVNFTFQAQDQYGNELQHGGAGFAASVEGAFIKSGGNSSSASVADFGNGSYSVTASFYGSGSQYLAVYIPSATSTTSATATAITSADTSRNSSSAVAAAAVTTAAVATASSSLLGSPFEVYVLQPNECGMDDVVQTVSDCSWTGVQFYNFNWTQGSGPDSGGCRDGIDLPAAEKWPCSIVPAASKQVN
jgi:hypothetical protein